MKKVIALLLSLLVVIGSLTVVGFADEITTPTDLIQEVVETATDIVEETNAPQVIYSNTINNIEVALYDNGEFVVSGEGDMPDFTPVLPNGWTQLNPEPWYKNNSQITKVIINEGITSIGKCNFQKCANLTEVVIPSTLNKIGAYAFYENTALTIIDLSNVSSIGDYGFFGCTNLNVETNAELGKYTLDTLGNQKPAFSVAREILDVADNYLNEVCTREDYELNLDVDYISSEDKVILTNFVNTIVDENDSELEKANKIYDWVKTNIQLQHPDYVASAIAVFNYRYADCVGVSQLTSALMKCANIKTVICRGQKLHTRAEADNDTFCTLERVYKGSNGHQWIMAYTDGQWTLYDAIWDHKAITDRDYIASWYFLEHIDMVSTYLDKDITQRFWGIAGVDKTYVNGELLSIYFGELNSGAGSVAIGSSIRYEGTTLSEQTNLSFVASDGSNKLGSTTRYCAWPEGLYQSNNTRNRYYTYVTDNGCKLFTTIRNIDGTNYYFNEGKGIIVTDYVAHHSIMNKKLITYVGETFECNTWDYAPLKLTKWDKYTEGCTFSSTVPSVATIDENGVITTLSTGNTTIKFKSFNTTMSFELAVYPYDNNPTVEQYCDHNHTFVIENYEVCCYCGKSFEKEVTEETTTVTDMVETFTDVITVTDVELTNTDVEEITMTDVTSTDIEEVIISETDIVSETDLEVITNTDAVETPTNFVTETNTEEVTTTDVVTETDTDIPFEELEIGSGEYDPEAETDTPAVETPTDVEIIKEIVDLLADLVTTTDVVEEVTNTDVTTATATDEVVDYSELVRQELEKAGIFITKEEWEKDLDDEDPEAEKVIESNMTIIPEVVVAATPKVEAPVVSSGRSSGGSGSGSSKKVVATPVVKTEEVKVETTTIEEIKVEEVVELPVVEEVKTDVTETVEVPVENTSNVNTVVKSSEKEIIKSEVNTNEIAESVEQMFETISVALTNMVKSLNTLLTKLFR